MKKTIKYLLILFTLFGSLNSYTQGIFLMEDLVEWKKKNSQHKKKISVSQFVKELKTAANQGKNYTLDDCSIIYEKELDEKYLRSEKGTLTKTENVLVVNEEIYFPKGTVVRLSNCSFYVGGMDFRIKNIHFWDLFINDISTIFDLNIDGITVFNKLNVSGSATLDIKNSNINYLNYYLTDSIYALISNKEDGFSREGLFLRNNKITSCRIGNIPTLYVYNNNISYLELFGDMEKVRIDSNTFNINFRNWRQIEQTTDNVIKMTIESGIKIANKVNIKELQISCNIGKSIKQLENDSLIRFIKKYKDSTNIYPSSRFYFKETYPFNDLKKGELAFQYLNQLITEEQLQLLEKLNHENDSLKISHITFPEINIKDSDFEVLRLSKDTLAVVNIQNNIIKKKFEITKLTTDSVVILRNNTLPAEENVKIDETIFKNIGFNYSSKSYYGDEDYHQIKELLDNEKYNSSLDELIITHRKFINILNQQGSSAKKIGVLKLKNIQTNMQMHEYYKEPSLNAWFNWQGFKFLRWYSDYGTNPFKALTYCFWAMLYFALFYFFFYSDWDKIDRGFLIKRFNSVMDYFTTEKRIEDFYSSTHDKEMTTFTEFKDTLEKNKVYMPSMLASLARPIYQISLLRYKLLNFSYKKAEFMAGRKWVDLENKDRYWIGTLTFFLTLIYIIYLILIRAINSLVLSINAFSTLGFGQIPVRGFTKYVAIIEGFIGWFLLSVFIVSLLSQMMSV